MKKSLPLFAVALASAFVLAACEKKAETAAQPVEQKPVVIAKPADPADIGAWREYMKNVVTNNMEGVKTMRPYVYFIPSGQDDKSKSDYANQLDNVKTTVARGVLPGNMMAFGGPDSAVTAQFVTEAFTGAQNGSFKDVRVLFIGAAADLDKVKQAVAPTSADVRFVEAK